MAKRQREWAQRAKLALITQLGNRCVSCGKPGPDLEFNHIYKRKWVSKDLEWSHRISTYRLEAKFGLLNLMCPDCNKHYKPVSMHWKTFHRIGTVPIIRNLYQQIKHQKP